MTLIWKLLRKHISIFELAVFFVANLIGLVVILAGVQIYNDAKPFMGGGEESLIGNDYVAISKSVDDLGANKDKGFTQEEIDELLAHDCINNVGRFTPSNFEVHARLELGMGQRPFSTMMFFEAVPDDFIDVSLDEWRVDTEKVLKNRDDIESGRVSANAVDLVEIPIIIPRNYLNLYNFGFSRSQDLPQITDKLIQRLYVDVTIEGSREYINKDGYVVNYEDKYLGRIIGFSDRLNTILVPQQFMEWANQYYALPAETSTDDELSDANATENPSRLMLEVTNPSDPKLLEFLDKKGYISEGKPSESGKAMVILQRSVAVVVVIGALFCLLSIIILTLSIYLLLQKNIDKLENLVLIGHTPMMVSMPYIIMTIVLNVSIMLVSFILVGYGRSAFLEPIFNDFLHSGLTTTMAPTYITGLVLTAAIICFNIFIIYHKVSQISKKR